MLARADNRKARFRLATALVRLEQPERALDLAAALVAEAPRDASFAALDRDARRALREQQTGEYDFARVAREEEDARSPPGGQRRGARREPSAGLECFHADYVSPSVALGET